jgi:molybdate transport system substrate-binding protein
MRILQGKADAGVTWASKVQFQKKLGNPIGGVEIPGAQNITATYAAGVMVNAPHLRAAAQWLRYLNAPELLAIYHEFGFHSIQEHAAQNRGADAVF